MNRTEALVASLRTDIHSHFLPGVDDGVSTIEEAMLILRTLKELGFSKVVTTPHIDSAYYPNTCHTLKKVYDSFKGRFDETGVEVILGAEYMLDETFINWLRGDEPLLSWDRYLLFETTNFAEPLFLEEAVYLIQSKGFFPVLAHPERYVYLEKSREKIEKLKNIGVFFQMTVGALEGQYGSQARVNAKWLWKQGYIDFLGSDLHRPSQLERFRKGLNERMLQNRRLENIRNRQLFNVDKKS